MKIIKRIALLLIIILVISIYISNIDNKIYYVSLGDSLAEGIDPYGKISYGYSDYVESYLKQKKVLEAYTKKFASSGTRTTDLIREIEINKTILIDNKEVTIKNALMNADLITLSIGSNDLFYKLGINSFDFNINNINDLYTYVDDISLDIEKLIVLIQKYCKEDIILIGYYNPLSNKESLLTRELEPIFIYINSNLKKISKKHNIHYVDIYQIFKENPQYLPNPVDIHPSSAGYEIISKEIITIIEKKIFSN